MSDRQIMMKIYSAISEALTQCDDAAYRAGQVGEYTIQQYCLEAMELLDKAERRF